MSSDTITIELQKREIIRKKLAGLRENGEVPVVVHDHGKPSIHASGAMVPLQKVVTVAGKHHPIELKVGSEDRLVLIRDVDYNPRTHHLRHVVFQAIRRNKKAHAEIPIEFNGDIPAERSSLMVIYQLDHVEVEALPSDLPDMISVDPSPLKDVGDTMLVGDLKAPKGVTILTEATYPIATVEMPKDQLAEADASAESLAEDAESDDIADEVPAIEVKSDEDKASEDDAADSDDSKD